MQPWGGTQAQAQKQKYMYSTRPGVNRQSTITFVTSTHERKAPCIVFYIFDWQDAKCAIFCDIIMYKHIHVHTCITSVVIDQHSSNQLLERHHLCEWLYVPQPIRGVQLPMLDILITEWCHHHAVGTVPHCNCTHSVVHIISKSLLV